MKRPLSLHIPAGTGLGALLGAAGAFVLTACLFFLSAGTWRHWPEYTRYYDDLATAFRAGHLHLELQPPASLLALPDPYDRRARNQVPEVKAFVERSPDLSFYQGRFYLYWGPAPALLLASMKHFYTRPIPDQYLVFAFTLGLQVFTALLILELRRRHYANVPNSLVVMGILVAALANPIPWMFSRAAIYEATIAAGQFFLIGGMYFAYMAVDKRKVSRTALLVAPVFWALAAGSRTLAIVPAAFLTAMLVAWDATRAGHARPDIKSVTRALTLGLPLVLGVLGLGWYNWVRFGSVLQTGLRYTLTFRNLDLNYSRCFSVLYVLPNLWMYLFNRFHTLTGFPFIGAALGSSPGFMRMDELKLHHAEAVTGLLFSVPFVLFSVVAAANLAAWISGRPSKPRMNVSRERQLVWISVCLAGSAFLSFAAILFYFNVTMRFLAEFLPSLILLSILGVWQGYGYVHSKPVWRNLFMLSSISLGSVTVAIGLLLAVKQY